MLEFLNKYIFGVGVPIILIISGIYFLFLLKGFHITKTRKILKVFTKKNNNNGTSPLKALMLALAGTLGVGNIVGVSAAIYLGGFGAVFWMWVSAFLSMLLKYAEIVLAIKHRRYDKDGTPHGSAMFYIRDHFDNLRFSTFGKILSGIFAVLCIVNPQIIGSIPKISLKEVLTALICIILPMESELIIQKTANKPASILPNAENLKLSKLSLM